jgi:hypothetical protein
MAKRSIRIEVEPFRRLTSTVTSEVRKRAAEIAAAMDASKVEVAFA